MGRGHSLLYLRYKIWRLQAQARRNQERRRWRVQLLELEDQIEQLKTQGKPVGRIQRLLGKARDLVESGVDSMRHAPQPDTVVRAIREVQKEVERVRTSTETSQLLIKDLLEGKIPHRDLAFNAELLQRLRVYEFRSGGDYQAPTEEAVRAHYRARLANVADYDQLRLTDLRLPDDQSTIEELVAEGFLELSPNDVQVQGVKGMVSYPVEYGFARVEGAEVPVGVIVVPEATYERNGAQYGRASKFPTLPHGITLLIRVKIKLQTNEVTSHAYPDGKALQNEVARCRARLRNPKQEEAAFTFAVSPRFV
ncbi:MAG TPA: hypothetical protein VFT87_00505 [Candidatus Saccharimonadales bacterium]|nr:hypothetical protein [Candidatus Saccharimonadales bacterium]